jgi:hypothetical protein
MPLALAGSLTAVQFCYPAELSLALNKIEHFSKVSNLLTFPYRIPERKNR